MRIIKALLTGAKFGIELDRYLNDLVYECHETDRNTTSGYQIVYEIEVPNYDKTKRLITARGAGFKVEVHYNLEELVHFNVYNGVDTSICEVDFVNQTLTMRIRLEDDKPYKFKFEDMRSPDFLFNFDIEYGIGEAIKEYMQEIDYLISEYGVRQYIQ